MYGMVDDRPEMDGLGVSTFVICVESLNMGNSFLVRGVGTPEVGL